MPIFRIHLDAATVRQTLSLLCACAGRVGNLALGKGGGVACGLAGGAVEFLIQRCPEFSNHFSLFIYFLKGRLSCLACEAASQRNMFPGSIFLSILVSCPGILGIQ
jgi:hypothetical protein